MFGGPMQSSLKKKDIEDKGTKKCIRYQEKCKGPFYNLIQHKKQLKES